jgi:hypothetical protein
MEHISQGIGMATNSPPPNADTVALMNAGRLLIQMGRSWLPLTADIQRGATAVVKDPHYGSEIVDCAMRTAHESNEPVLLARVVHAKERVERNWASHNGRLAGGDDDGT